MENFDYIYKKALALKDDLASNEGNIANLIALLYHEVDNLNWVGLYLEKEGILYLNQFQGLPACTRIKIPNGVCGRAFSEEEIIAVDNVHEFPGHIACDSRSLSELVIPLFKDNKCIGVFDIDSLILERFKNRNLILLFKQVALLIEKYL